MSKTFNEGSNNSKKCFLPTFETTYSAKILKISLKLEATRTPLMAQESRLKLVSAKELVKPSFVYQSIFVKW